MEFFFDETSIPSYFKQNPVNTSGFEILIELLEKASSHSLAKLHIIEDFYSTDHEDATISDLMYSSGEDGDTRDLLRRLEHIINQSTSLSVLASTDCWAAAHLKAKERGCLVSTSKKESYPWWNPLRMHRLSVAEEIPYAARQYYVQESIEEAKFPEYSKLMFESIYFHEPAEKIKNLGGNFVADIETIVSHLGYLNDHAISDFSESATDRETSIKAGSKGIDMSPESNNTRRNRAAMSLREVTVFDQKISCEWHTKIKPTLGRIHFYPWSFKNEVLAKKIGRKIIVGIMCRHL